MARSSTLTPCRSPVEDEEGFQLAVYGQPLCAPSQTLDTRHVPTTSSIDHAPARAPTPRSAARFGTPTRRSSTPTSYCSIAPHGAFAPTRRATPRSSTPTHRNANLQSGTSTRRSTTPRDQYPPPDHPHLRSSTPVYHATPGQRTPRNSGFSGTTPRSGRTPRSSSVGPPRGGGYSSGPVQAAACTPRSTDPYPHSIPSGRDTPQLPRPYTPSALRRSSSTTSIRHTTARERVSQIQSAHAQIVAAAEKAERDLLMEHEVQRIPSRQLTCAEDVEAHAICCICQEDWCAGDVVKTLPDCTHTFHKHCIDRWLTGSKSTCPVCVKPVGGRAEVAWGEIAMGQSGYQPQIGPPNAAQMRMRLGLAGQRELAAGRGQRPLMSVQGIASVLSRPSRSAAVRSSSVTRSLRGIPAGG
mmetsp:Transcript_121818/g.211529  ORF Transcript_121818/g.211529 Transcript_121818/m.211529 type:complete len:412 (-) Transcript_121818:1376-2611(-)